jgi:hypothetical protein
MHTMRNPRNSGSSAGAREEELHLRRKLLALAVQVQRHGPEALQDAQKDGAAKVEYRKEKEGFELLAPLAIPNRSALGKPVVLRVGTANQEKNEPSAKKADVKDK